MVAFLGCTGAVFAQSSWVRGVSRDFWSYTGSIIENPLATAPVPTLTTTSNSNPAAADPWSADANLAGRQMRGVVDGLLFSTNLGGSAFFATARGALTSTAPDPLSLTDTAARSADSSNAKFQTVSASSGMSSFAVPAPVTVPLPVAPPPDLPIPQNPPANTLYWQGPGGTTSVPTSGNWSASENWSPHGPPTSGVAHLLFFGSGTTQYTSTNDMGAFTFVDINFYCDATVTETINGDALLLPTSGSGTINQQGTGSFIIANDIRPISIAPAVSTLHLTSASNINGGDVTFTGTIANEGSPHHLALSQEGTNTVILTGANTYSGGTVVNAGTLLANNVTGSATGSGSVTVNSGGFLGGTGTIITSSNADVGFVTVNSGGNLTGGNNSTVGHLTLTTPNLNFQTFGTLQVDLGGAIADLISLSGSLNISDSANINFFQLSALTESSYTLVTYDHWNGTEFRVFGLPANYELNYGASALTLTEVPEPATWAAGALALLGAAFLSRKKLRRG